MRPLRPPLGYYGSKWRIAPWIISHFPPHKVYVEAYGGAAGVLLRKPRSYVEVYNDLNADLVNMFRVLRDPDQASELMRLLALTPYARAEFLEGYEVADNPVERARRTVVRANMGWGSKGSISGRTGFRGADWRSSRKAKNLQWPELPEHLMRVVRRLRGVVIEQLPALELIPVHDGPETLFYIDPPYPFSSRSSGRRHNYVHEMDDEAHGALAETLKGLTGFVIVSGYPDGIYDDLYRDWSCYTKRATTQGNARETSRLEAIWLSERTQEYLEGARLL